MEELAYAVEGLVTVALAIRNRLMREGFTLMQANEITVATLKSSTNTTNTTNTEES